jgi:predicted transposase YdaD
VRDTCLKTSSLSETVFLKSIAKEGREGRQGGRKEGWKEGMRERGTKGGREEKVREKEKKRK